MNVEQFYACLSAIENLGEEERAAYEAATRERERKAPRFRGLPK